MRIGKNEVKFDMRVQFLEFDELGGKDLSSIAERSVNADGALKRIA